MMVNNDFREKLQKKCPTDDCCPYEQQVVWEAILGV
jgi:hypothetical protein